MTDLLLLAERVEGAEASEQGEFLMEAFKTLPHDGNYYWQHPDWLRFQRLLLAEAYESAALTLLPAGWSFEIKRNYCHLVTEEGVRIATEGWGATPALALTAACLRARHSMEGLT